MHPFFSYATASASASPGQTSNGSNSIRNDYPKMFVPSMPLYANVSPVLHFVNPIFEYSYDCRRKTPVFLAYYIEKGIDKIKIKANRFRYLDKNIDYFRQSSSNFSSPYDENLVHFHLFPICHLSNSEYKKLLNLRTCLIPFDKHINCSIWFKWELEDKKLSLLDDVLFVKVLIGEMSDYIFENSIFYEKYLVLPDKRRVLNKLFRVTAVFYFDYIDLFCKKIKNVSPSCSTDDYYCSLAEVWLESGINVGEEFLTRIKHVNGFYFDLNNFILELDNNKL